MRAISLAALALIFVRAEPVDARVQGTAPVARPSTSSIRTEEATRAAIDQVARRYGLAGEVLVGSGDTVLLDRGYGPIAPNGTAMHKPGGRWRLASITKQVTATLIARDFGALLDQPVQSRLYPMLPNGFDGLTLRQLLTHHSGLANPDDTAPTPAGIPDFYTHAEPDPTYCFGAKSSPGGPFSYNNCDYIVADSLGKFQESSLRPWPAGMAMARPGEMGVPGFVRGKTEPAYQLASFGAAGGLIGTARAVFRFDRDLMTGTLVSSDKRAALWTPEGGRSYQALGQWVFPGRLPGCAAPKRIVQRDGEIGGVQTRNFILPDDDLIVIVFTNRSSDDFAMGEVWEGKGFVYDLLGAVACS